MDNAFESRVVVYVIVFVAVDAAVDASMPGMFNIGSSSSSFNIEGTVSNSLHCVAMMQLGAMCFGARDKI